MTVTRRNHGSGHYYELDGERAPGVTGILGDAFPKPALIDWAGRTTSSYAVDHWDELAELPPTKRYDVLNKARWAERDAAARRGTEVHRLGEALVKGVEVEVPEELEGHVESYVDFLNRWDPQPILVEAVLANRTVGYCGTVDLVADMAGERWLIDLKTARSGIFGDTALQLCAYARAEVYVMGGIEESMADLGISRVAGLHIRSDGWDLRETEWGDEVWTFFRHLAWLARRIHREDDRHWVGPALDVPPETIDQVELSLFEDDEEAS